MGRENVLEGHMTPQYPTAGLYMTDLRYERRARMHRTDIGTAASATAAAAIVVRTRVNFSCPLSMYAIDRFLGAIWMFLVGLPCFRVESSPHERDEHCLSR